MRISLTKWFISPFNSSFAVTSASELNRVGILDQKVIRVIVVGFLESFHSVRTPWIHRTLQILPLLSRSPPSER